MSKYRSLALTILAIFIITLLGAYFSPTFHTQKTYLELFMAFGALLFIFSLVSIFALLGFQSFALYMAIVLAIVIAVFGILGALILVLVTYIIWGSVFAMEILLFDAGTVSAKEWFIQRYTFKTFKAEYYIFYPMLGFVYLLLEVIPSMMKRESMIDFSPSRVLKEMEEVLE